MKKVIAGIFSTFIVIGLLAPTGGYPSRPNFQAVTIAGKPVNPPVAIVLASDSVKASTTTFAPDATLQTTVTSAGTYKLEFNSTLSGMTTGQGGLQINFATSSAVYSVTNAAFTCTYYDGSGTPVTVVISGAFFTTAPTSGNTCYYAPSANAINVSTTLYMVGFVTITAGTTFSINWTQSTSNATNTILRAGSVFTVTRVL